MAKNEKQAHESREQESRTANPVHDVDEEPWVRPTALNAPTARKGYRQRWIRCGAFGKDDSTNIARKFREGWKPRPMETVPDADNFQQIGSGRFVGFIGIEGMVLCEMPEKRARQRDAYYKGLTQARTQAIDQQLERAGQILKGRGFGPIQTVEKTSVPVREVPLAPDVEEAEDIG